ncbi:hypothetical protein [Alicyclobacillus sp. ALC3]|uniref:hypothetical protein n=1 Tax=Alicyclobacillus sp. ALC3 TaxID=2796143 RepID=UPI002377EB31|nr:hypothetical protein [Alicyclobacillus sp. ALC3]WDL95797.1 hypothetical protein JC200_15730 [Alicyclobacillus sp. ALC3]
MQGLFDRVLTRCKGRGVGHRRITYAAVLFTCAAVCGNPATSAVAATIRSVSAAQTLSTPVSSVPQPGTYGNSTQPGAPSGTTAQGNATQPKAGAGQFETVLFRVGSPSGKRVSGARVIVLDPDGDIVTTGLTDATGEWGAPVPIQVDGRFASVRRMGTVAAIVVATGYNEQVIFTIPVLPHAVQPVILNPITPGARNEPLATLGNLHRQDVRVLIDTYANKLGLKRQPPVHGEYGYAPWGPGLEPRMTRGEQGPGPTGETHVHTGQSSSGQAGHAGQAGQGEGGSPQ